MSAVLPKFSLQRPTLGPAPWGRGLSFRQLLLAALLLITALMGGAAVQALSALDRSAWQGRQAAQDAVALTARAQSLAELTVAMERSARQYLVLEDPGLRQRFDAALREARTQAGGMAAAPDAALQAWGQQADAVVAILQQPGRRPREALAQLGPRFVRLHALNETLGAQGRQVLQQRQREQLAALERQQRLISALVLGTLVLGAGLAWGLAHWLARPMAQLVQAIGRLGNNQLEAPIQVRGPADLRQLGRQLDWLRLRLAELESDQARFVRHVSHELKTPLAAIREGVALLQDGVAGPLAADQAEILRILHDNSLALQQQIEALLRYQALAFETPRAPRQRQPLAPLLHAAAEAQRLQSAAKGLHVTVQADASVTAAIDPETLGSAVANLLSNALRFSPADGQVTLRAGHTPEGVQIDCIDQGPGVAEADAAHVFEPFFQGRPPPPDASGTPPARQGSGVGLAIVREVAQAHGGSARLLPSAHGAHFCIQLPR
ncbi:sensor histidine kinase [Aquabacterium sp. OR-4]|uniref:sensor histidine kinase n=1 Tax=Aquabacterium sp. OR-4 TaxID=2978127 RepID=UPI0021B31FF6|nr:ATP-binding protein [Aquabacterium sp. OR-4]MDT7834068.1 ATP-binding protein [Aquabacterium sp. OR-4]